MNPSHEIPERGYQELVAKLREEAALEFRAAGSDQKGRRSACCRYLKRGALAGMAQGELIDFLGVSSPSVLDIAGYPENEAQAVMEIMAQISDKEISDAQI